MSDKFVLVTGGTGYLGCHVVQGLLRQNYVVRVSVRKIEGNPHIKALQRLVGDMSTQLSFVEADVTDDHGWEEACRDCQAVIHLAGILPGLFSEVSDETFLTFIPNGIRRVMTAAAVESVPHFVYVSSIPTVSGNPMPIIEGQVFTEEDWTDENFPKLEGHAKGLTVAEKFAWDFIKKLSEDKKMELTVLVASGAIGPPLIQRTLNGTLEVLDAVLNHKFPGCPNSLILFSDVRDIATACVKSLSTAEAIGERIIIHTDGIFMPDMCKILAEEFGPQGYTIFTNTLPKFVLWLPSLFNKKINLTQNLGKTFYFNTGKMKSIFGLQPRPIKQSLFDMVYAMVDLGFTFKGTKYRQVGSRALPQGTTT